MFTVPESFLVMLQEAAVGLPEIIAQTFFLQLFSMPGKEEGEEKTKRS
jgi:hypothetical protein